MNSLPFSIDSNWSLFLDRDGVINQRIVGDYVKNPTQFLWIPGSLEAIAAFNSLFKHIFIVTNQQGIGKGLFSMHDLELVHQHMMEDIQKAGGRIDHIWVAPQLEKEHHPDRKPGIGMALKAKAAFPEVQFEKSLLIGDSGSDITMGKRAGMKTIFIGPENTYQADAYATTLHQAYQLIHLSQN